MNPLNSRSLHSVLGICCTVLLCICFFCPAQVKAFISPERTIQTDQPFPSAAPSEQGFALKGESVASSAIDRVSLSSLPAGRNSTASAALSLLQNGSGTFPDLPSARAVWKTSYDMALDNTALETATVSKMPDGSIRLSIQNYSENRQAITDAVIRHFGLMTYTGSAVSPYELIRSTSARVAAGLQYDRNYRMADMQTSLHDGKGVCQQYSIICYILLNAQGIPTRRVRGTLTVRESDGTVLEGFHTWNCCLVDGRWIPVDFTPYSNGMPNAGIVSAARCQDYKEW